MEKRKWTKEEKLPILKEGEEHGTQLTIRKCGVMGMESLQKEYLVGLIILKKRRLTDVLLPSETGYVPMV